MRSALRGLRDTFKALPSLFDWAVVAYLMVLSFIGVVLPQPWLNVSTWIAQGSVIIFGSIVLIIIAMMEPERLKWHSLPLGIFVLWALISLFRHSLGYSASLEDFINWALLNEGFIFVIFGALMITTIVRHAKNYRLYYIPMAIAFWSFILQYRLDSDRHFSLTNFMAAGIAFVIIAKVKGWNKTALAGILYGLAIVAFKWKFLLYKFHNRPIIWKVAWHKITLLGIGWNHGPLRDAGWIWPEVKGHGWAFINNDLLELGVYLGVVGMVIAVWFFLSILKRPRFGIPLFFVLTFLISSMFQRTLFFNLPAGIFLVAVATLVKDYYALD